MTMSFLSRRAFLQRTMLLASGTLLAACSQPAPSAPAPAAAPTTALAAPAATTAPAAAAAAPKPTTPPVAAAQPTQAPAVTKATKTLTFAQEAFPPTMD